VQSAELGIAVQDDVDGVLHVGRGAVLDVREDAPPCRLLDKGVVVGVDVGDHGARGLLDDRRNQVEPMALASIDTDDRDVGALAPCRVGDL
jgi:hypothetical protein